MLIHLVYITYCKIHDQLYSHQDIALESLKVCTIRLFKTYQGLETLTYSPSYMYMYNIHIFSQYKEENPKIQLNTV